jgi:hypothetical protein
MKWLRRKLCSWLGVESWRDHEESINFDEVVPVDRSHFDSNTGIHFNVYKAQGGIIVQTNFYNNTRNQKTPGLYIINDEENLGQEIAHQGS